MTALQLAKLPEAQQVSEERIPSSSLSCYVQQNQTHIYRFFNLNISQPCADSSSKLPSESHQAGKRKVTKVLKILKLGQA